MSLAAGPLPVNARPSRPSESQATKEPSPPERSAVVGWTVPSLVAVSRTEKAASMALTKPSSRTPVTSSHTVANATTQPVAAAARRPNQRLSNDASQRYRRRMPRPVRMKRKKKSTATTGEAMTSATL